MKTIEFEAKLDKPQAAFIIFYALDGIPWANYEESNNGDLVVPTCLMANRADGDIGFVGGKVNPNEKLVVAVRREAEEEIGYTGDVALEPLVAHDLGPLTAHSFTAQLPYSELRSMQQEAAKAVHFGSEIAGLFLPHLIDYDTLYGKGGGISRLFRASMAPSVREELTHFLVAKKIIPEDHLHAVVATAGYSLSELLDRDQVTQ